MHTEKSVVRDVVALLAEVHRVYDVPDFVDLGLRRDRLALLAHIVAVEIDERHINRNFALRLFFTQTVVNVADIGAVHVAAAAAALDVFDCRLAEQRHTFSGRERQRAAFIFEQHHAFARSLARECRVRRGRRYTPAVIAQRDAGLVFESCIFFHVSHSRLSDCYHYNTVKSFLPEHFQKQAQAR